MLTRISQEQAQSLIQGIVPEIQCDFDFCKHYEYILPNGDIVEYCLDKDDFDNIDERWNLIDNKSLPRLAP